MILNTLCLPHLYFKCSVYDIWLYCFYNASGILFKNKAFFVVVVIDLCETKIKGEKNVKLLLFLLDYIGDSARK